MSDTASTLTIRIPLTIRQRGGKKLLLAPDASAWPKGTEPQRAMVKAVARAFRWRRMLETGQFASVDDLAAAEKINSSYVSRVLRLTLLAPNLVEAILDGRQSPELTLPTLMAPFPAEWDRQPGREGLGGAQRSAASISAKGRA